MSRSLNRVMLIGKVVSLPDLESTSKGVSVITFYIMTDRQWRKDDELRTSSTVHACVAWDKLAEICSDILTVGDTVYVEGSLENKTLVNNAGIEKEISEVVINEMKLLKRGNDKESYG